MSHPVSFDLERPETFQRAHVFLRVALLIVIGSPPCSSSSTSATPGACGDSLLGIVGWGACLAAYLSSLVDRYPPFMLEAGPLSGAAHSS